MKPKTEREKDLDAFPEPTDWSSAKQGPIVPPEPGKTQISIRLDNDVLDWFRDQVERAGKGSYQTNMNAALRAHMLSESGMLAETLRTIVREEVERVLQTRLPEPEKRAAPTKNRSGAAKKKGKPARKRKAS